MADLNNTIELYDEIALDYDRHMATTGHYQAQSKLFGKLKKYFSSPILDLAAGPGFLAELLVSNDLQVILNDYSKTMFSLLEAKFKNDPHIIILNQDAHKIRTSIGMNTILCSNLFYYINDYEKAIKNWTELLNLGGHIIVFEEYPFQKSQSGPMSKHEADLAKIVKPLAPIQIVNVFRKNNFFRIDGADEQIDDKHSLHGFVFGLEAETKSSKQ